VFEINVRGTFLCCQAAVPLMLARGGGRIVNLASGAAYLPPGGFPITAYGPSKAAVHRFSEMLADQLSPRGVFVFSISPGLVRTAMTESHWGLDAASFAFNIPPTANGGAGAKEGGMTALSAWRPRAHRPPIVPANARRRHAEVLAYLGCAGALGYGAMKVVWALGGTVGLRNPKHFRAIDNGLSAPGRFFDHWGTPILAGLAIVILLGLI